MSGINPVLVERAAIALYGEGWETAHHASRQYHRESAEAALLAVAESLRVEGALREAEEAVRGQALMDAADALDNLELLGEDPPISTVTEWLRSRAKLIAGPNSPPLVNGSAAMACHHCVGSGLVEGFDGDEPYSCQY